MDDVWQPDDRARAAEVESGTPFDLSVCLNEPIHRLGGIQSYGALVAFGADGVVEVASSNCAALLGVGAEVVVGMSAEALLGAESLAAVRGTLEAPTGDRGVVAVTVGGRGFDATVYRADGRVVVELEPAAGERPFVFSQFFPAVRAALVKLQHGRTVVDVCAAAVAEIRALTGYDRVVAYRFEGPAGPGEVIAESVAVELEPWLGLWFPATDIPPQARRLYERNWIRVIHDVDDDTAVLLPRVLPGSGDPLDLSDSTLRTVSGFHLEYLRNIGVRSSMSVSLLDGGRLWGLIACHGLAPRRLGAEVRAACEFFGVTLSLQLAAVQEAEASAGRQRARAALFGLVTDPRSDVPGSLLADSGVLGEVIAADAVVVRFDGRTTGGPLAEGVLAALWGHLPALGAGQVWSCESLAELDPVFAPYAEQVSGVLVLALDGAGDVVVWARRERRAARTWAADPDEPVRVGPRGQRLTPRGSSAVYQAVVRGRCVPWTAADEAVAEEFGHAVRASAVRRAVQLAAVNDELRQANDDLDTFTHVAAHEMKEPLRGIATTAAFITEDAPELDETTARRLGTIQKLAQRMDELINSLLHFAQLGQGALHRVPVDLREAAERALEVAGIRLAEHDVAVTLPEPGVLVTADAERLQEILVNLLVNAAKYANPVPPRTVAVGAVPGEPPTVFVRDNGIGIPQAHQEDVFRLFRRLHPRDSHGGGHGAGLAIVDRIVQRHGGQLRLESTPAEGTTVWFTLEG
ncbi:light-regulated signal transduction histidine kinase (bacteriophytochrome) [Actinokineospora baliensis]|uniref:ATP-binding protein n=1 Tax=Actinokineospora baliensis TaxID=547056 RepID=UPI0019561D06|nr:ATP-binding protein [Actinokineospora baliensis]MBM7774474.1 light-regulated signal transduction histidine kinase (bacteriophytochrome) [Actinokineospora baliensis]